MSRLFDPCELAGLNLRNRLVRSATYDGSGLPGGQVSPRQVELYRALAQGGVGLIISGIVNVDRAGRVSKFQNSLHEDKFIPGLARLVEVVHKEGARIAVQLFHGGRECARYRGPKATDLALGPSPPQDDPYFVHDNRAMTVAEIEQTVEAFGAAARRAQEAGFDAVQVHGAHAYLFAQFLSPQCNQRDDEWGGDLAGRLRLHLAVLANIREQVGPDYPVMFKLGLADGFDGGLTLEEGLEAAQRLARAGCDGLEISLGLRGRLYEESEFHSKVDRPGGEGYFAAWAQAVKQRVAVPVMAVGGVRTSELAQRILDQGQADLVALSRPLISQPDLPARWQAGDQSRARCISCNKCFEGLLKLRPLACVLEGKQEA